MKAERRVDDAARWRLAIGEPLLAGGFTWIAFPRPQISLLFLARRSHLIALTDRRIMIWARPHEVRPADDTDLVLDAPFSEVVLEGVRTAMPMLQMRIRTTTGRQLVLEFRPKDRKLGHRIAQALERDEPDPGDADSGGLGRHEQLMAVVLSIDAGTTGTRTLAIDEHGQVRRSAYREFTQHFPQPGWVEHDAEEIWTTTLETLAEVAAATAAAGETVACIGITNQRETTVVWSRATGKPLHRAIVWQDRRTAAACDAYREAGLEPLVRRRTGLVLDPYFSATKLGWLLRDGGVPADSDLAFGTVDSWILYRLTGGRVHATDASNASRTLLFDIGELAWSSELCEAFGVPQSCLPEVQPSSGRFGVSDPEAAAGLAVPVSGIAGDQQAALFGQACFEPGMAKNTYGTGSFVLVNLGATLPEPVDGLLTTVAWQRDIGGACETTYAMEGAIFVTGAAVQWLRDGINIIDHAAEIGPLAESVPDNGGVTFVPAFTGLGSPHWDPYARGTILGLSRGTGRAHIARAVIESMAYQTRDVVDAVTDAAGVTLAELRVDGGASAMNLLCQFQADLLGVPVRRPAVQETTALGAAYLAGLAEGVWATPAEAADAWTEEATFSPAMPTELADAGLTTWRRAVERSRDWAASS